MSRQALGQFVEAKSQLFCCRHHVLRNQRRGVSVSQEAITASTGGGTSADWFSCGDCCCFSCQGVTGTVFSCSSCCRDVSSIQPVELAAAAAAASLMVQCSRWHLYGKNQEAACRKNQHTWSKDKLSTSVGQCNSCVYGSSGATELYIWW